MRCFLPVENEFGLPTEVVIESSTGGYCWYTLERELDINDYATAFCPLRDGMTVLTTVVNGMRIWFLETQLKVVLPEGMLEKVTVAFSKIVKLEYDIPAVVSQNPTQYRDESGKSFSHPSIWMWGIGSRTSRSVWILPADRIPWRRIRSLIRAGCTYEITYVDGSDIINQLQRTTITLRNEWLKAELSYEECITSAKERRAEREQAEDCDMEDSKKKYENDCKRVERELNKKRENIKAGANLFSVPMEWVTEGKASVTNSEAQVTVTPTLRGMSASRRKTFDSKVEAHCEVVDKLKEKGHTALADALENNKVTHGIVADFAEENEVIDEDGTFSLRELFKDE